MVNDDASLKLRFTFNKEERLSSKKLIDELFNIGSSFYLYPFKIQTLPAPSNSVVSAQVLIAVSTKNFPRSVDRNQIKRNIRESYRLNKNGLHGVLNMENKKLLIAFIYTAKKSESSDLIRDKMEAILKRLSQLNMSNEKNSK